MADAFPRADLSLGLGDGTITNDQFWQITAFSMLKRTVDLDRFPGSVVVRRFRKGDVICRQGEFGATAFLILSRDDVRNLGLGGSRDEPVTYEGGDLRKETSAHQSRGVVSVHLEVVRSRDQQQGTPGSSRPLPGVGWLTSFLGLRAGAQEEGIPQADVSRGNLRAYLDEGELFGEMTAMASYPRSATVVAERDCVLLEMLRNVLEGLRLNPEFRERMEKLYSRQANMERIRTASFFRHFAEEQIDRILDAGRGFSLSPGETLYDEHDSPEEIYYILRGQVKVVKNGSPLLHEGGVDDWPAFCSGLVGGEETSHLRHSLWALLPEVARALVRSVASGHPPNQGQRLELVRALNGILRDRRFGEEAEVVRSKGSTMETGGRSETQVRHFNRLLLEEIVPGRVERSRGVHGPVYLLDCLAPGEVAGEMELFSGEPRLTSCVAEGSLTVLAFPRELLRDMAHADERLAVRVTDEIDVRRQRLADAMAMPVDRLGFASPFEELELIRGKSLLVVDLDRCTHCGDCLQACAATHDGVSRLMINGPKLGLLSVPSNCRGCYDPVCMVGCPVGSIRRHPGGALVIEDWCIGCGLCATNCPYDAIAMTPFPTGQKAPDPDNPTRMVPVVQQKATVCDLSVLLPGETPACVGSCAHDALHRVDPREHFLGGRGTPKPLLRELEGWKQDLVELARSVATAPELATPEAPRPLTPDHSPQPPPSPVKPSSADDEAFSKDTVFIHFPAPVAFAYRRFCQQRDSHERWVRLVKTLEALVKYLVFIGLSDLLDGMARSGDRNSALPPSAAFDFLRRPTKMTLGRWVETLRETARALECQPVRFVAELPSICRPGGPFDEVLLGPILTTRNLAEHTEGSLSLTREEYSELLRATRPKLEEALREIRFIRSYALGFVTTALHTVQAEGRFRYFLHSCMGARVVSKDDAFVMESETPWLADVPFLTHPDRTRLLHLWPFLLEREVESTLRPTLYGFEEIVGRDGQFLSRIRSAAIDLRDAWEQALHDRPPQDLSWLLDHIRARQEGFQAVPTMGLARKLSPSAGGQLAGRRLGPNELIAVIAEGGFGTIYEARNASGTRVAVKVLESREASRIHERFVLEFEKLKQAGGHPNVITCYEYGDVVIDDRSFPYFSMELAQGGDWSSRIVAYRERAAGRPLWEDRVLLAEVIDDFRTVVRTVAYLHDLGIVHRDLKPSNVLIMGDGTLKLSDFGLAKDLGFSSPSQRNLTSTGAVLGTPDYMAPEQAIGLDVGTPADLYALGVLLAELATGLKPLSDLRLPSGSTLSRWRPLDTIPRPLRRLIYRCTDVDPHKRPSDAKTVLGEFNWVVDKLV